MMRPYCERLRGTQPGNCCPDRLDDCSSPILDTLCYCDEFCDRGASGDCCPDYFSYCLGEKGPDPVIAGCNHRGRKLLPEQSVEENCNICKCVKVSDTLAELMCDTSKCLVQPELIGDINSQDAYGWRASNYSQFWGKKLNSGLQYLLGTRYPHDMINQMYPITKVFDPSLLPRSFDARTKREWRGLIGPVEDQGWCGASWAFSTATTAADRLAIQNSGPSAARLQRTERHRLRLRARRRLSGRQPRPRLELLTPIRVPCRDKCRRTGVP
ncbi:tubulointerstitial nephritis antigen-like [Pollicipes pollicipes]|uniref:tubulointerstitial nephritis antigen-like n=1 Tax=Pollicipes pollicipes TaxID=41117 RepID=UPI00188511EE|nr:tubulointerstitial nephritis antigen-like [Pollicipes pollicipes]